MKIRLQTFLPHIIILLVFFVMACVYMKPAFEKKVLYQNDIVQSQGASKEVQDYKKKTGEFSLWTNSMFSGMPSYTVMGYYPYSFTSNFAGFFSYLLPQPASLLFYLLAGFYLMMVVLRFSPWVSAVAAIGFAFCSYNLIIIEAGHVSKVFAVAYAPPLIAGTILIFRGKYLIGSILFSLFMMFQLYSNHIQITYYLGIALAIYAMFEFVFALREKRIKQYLIGASLLVLISAMSVGSMASRFWTISEYSRHTIRGGSELKTNTQANGGLDKDYAYGWSYGIGETFTYIIPNFNGGSSDGSLDKKSNVYQTLIDSKVTEEKLSRQNALMFANDIGRFGGQMYWGDQPSTSGPAYMGAVVCLLFVLGLFIVKNPLKWWILSVVVLFTMIAWGNNFALTDFFFDYLPLYNKFRAVTMIHSLVALLMAFMAGWALKTLAEKTFDAAKAQLYFKISIGFIGGLLIIMFLFKDSFLTFQKAEEVKVIDGKEVKVDADNQFKDNLKNISAQLELTNPSFANDVYEAFVADRRDAFNSDVLRSLILVLLAGGIIFAFLKNKINEYILIGGIAVLILGDMWGVCRRYLNDDNFVPKRKLQTILAPSEADNKILQDPDPHFRVFNRTVSTFNDATTSYFHKSIGGYSAAKMRRYQDLIEKYLGMGDRNVMNMLNAKYIITQTNDGVKIAIPNPDALGNAWFVKNYIWVDNADQELDTLDGVNLAKTAVIDKKFKDVVGNFIGGEGGTIRLTEYKPNQLTYESNSDVAQLAVFSEIYYDNGLGWESYVDGNPQKHFRTNYILRGMIIPAGKHKIQFRFEPQSYYLGEKISLICSLVLFGGLIGVIFYKFKKKKEEIIEL